MDMQTASEPSRLAAEWHYGFPHTFTHFSHVTNLNWEPILYPALLGKQKRKKKDIISNLSLPCCKRETLETDNTVLGQTPCEKKKKAHCICDLRDQG